MRLAEIIFEVTESDEGGYEARALGHSIFTQGEDWNDLKEMARDAVLCHFDEGDAPGDLRATLTSPSQRVSWRSLRADILALEREAEGLLDEIIGMEKRGK